MGTRWVALAAGVLGMAAIAMGCGGSGGDDGDGGSATAATQPLSKAEFVRRADAICKVGGKESEEELIEFIKEKAIPESAKLTVQQISEVGTDVFVPALRKQEAELRALEPPAGDADQVEEFLDGIDEAIGELEESPEKAKSTTSLFADTDKIAQELGFKVCGNR